MSSGSLCHKEAAARALSPLLYAARVHLAAVRPRVCTDCGYVFSPVGRDDRRCLDCAYRADPPPDDGPGEDCPDHGATDQTPCDKC